MPQLHLGRLPWNLHCLLHLLFTHFFPVVLLRPATPLTVYQHSSRIPCEDLGLILVPPQMPSTALWTPALETALLAICALLALLFVVLLRPVTPPTPLALFLCIMSLQLSLHARDPTAFRLQSGRTRWFWLHILLALCTSQWPIPIPNALTSTLLYHGLGGEGGEIRYRIASVLYPFSTES